jgi:acyl carrier protein
MITPELKRVILSALKLDDWDIEDDTIAAQVPGWDSLNHVNVVLAIEKHFHVHFKTVEILKLKNIGDLQRLLNSKLNKPV